MPTFIDEFVLTSKPLGGVIPYVLLIVTKFRTTIGLNDDLEVWKGDVTEIRVWSDDDWILRDNVPAIEGFHHPQNCCLEDVVTSPVGSVDYGQCALKTAVCSVSCKLLEHRFANLITSFTGLFERETVKVCE